MKQIIKSLFLSFLLLICLNPTKIFAYDIAVKNNYGVIIYYNYIGGTELEVTHSTNSSYSGTVHIPKMVVFKNNTRKVTRIGNEAFRNCKGLRSVSIPEGVTSINLGAFSGCTSLTTVAIPSSMKEIGNSVFKGCTGLTNLTIPSGVTSIGSSLFDGCERLTSLIVAKENSRYDSRNNCNAIIEKATNKLIVGCKSTVIPSSVKIIGRKAFVGCTSLKSVTIPSSVTNIEEGAFAGCDGLTSVTIPSSITSIEERAFYWCEGLRSATISEGVKRIGGSAFSKCTGLKSITIPSSVKTIAEDTFRGCTGLTSASFTEGVYIIGKSAFEGCTNLKNVTFPSSITTIGEEAFEGCKSLTNIVFPEGVVKIDDQAFQHCTGLTSVNIPSSVKSIGGSAFSGCSSLTSVTIPEGVTSISKYAFSNCSGLTSVTISEGVRAIGKGAFSDCTNLTNIDIPDSVTSIADDAFQNCTGLKNEVNYINIIINGVSYLMKPIEGGTFTMGATSEQVDAGNNERPIHEVTLNTFFIGKTEVTQALWEAVMGNNPSNNKGKNLPVENVSWNDCQEFIYKLNEVTIYQRPFGREFRLPTEAEWEFAARGGNKSNFFQYAGSSSIEDVAWYEANSNNMTHPVAEKRGNELGLYDMSGNVLEWCQDYYDKNFYKRSPSSNPCRDIKTHFINYPRVFRGGNCNYISKFCRVAFRSCAKQNYRNSNLGLRLAF